MKQTKIIGALATIGFASLLSACGGGGGDAGTSTPSAVTPVAASGVVNMGVTDGPSDTFNHVWVTIKAISFHTSTDAVWNPTDATWQTTTLATPITIDLAQLNNGAMNQVFSNLSLPVGSYKQIRFFFAGADDALTASAQAITDNQATPTPLQWNDQVEYVHPITKVVSEAPLEIAYPTQGIQLNGNFTVTEGSTLNLVTDFDLDKIIAPFRHDGDFAFTMRPNLHYFDLSQAGAIKGQIDPNTLCRNSASTNCAYNLIVHAEVLSADGSRHVAVRSTNVDPATGNFSLYPVSLKDSSGNALKYDLVIRGRNMETMVVTDVTPAGSLASGATVVQSTPLVPVINTNEYGAQFATPLTPLTNGAALFQQTLPIPGVATPVPYEIRWNNTEPFTGKLFAPFMLENAAVHVAAHNAGNALNFTTVTPTEGIGGYAVATNAIAYYDISSNTAIQAPTSGSLTTFTPPTPTIQANVENGTISGNIAISNATSYDSATLVIARFANIVTTQDISSLLASGGAFTVTGIPAGSATKKQAGAYYYGYVRLWKSGSHKRAKIVPINSMIDLRNTNSVTGLNVSISAK